MPTPLHHALTEPPLRELPPEVVKLLLHLQAPPRLGAHLRVVHDVAHQLTDWFATSHPELVVDRDAVLFGAATHDIGKVIHVEELSGPGTQHEAAGEARGWRAGEAFLRLDGLLSGLTEGADSRLAFQNSYPVG